MENKTISVYYRFNRKNAINHYIGSMNYNNAIELILLLLKYTTDRKYYITEFKKPDEVIAILKP